ncbi:MAG: dihydroorotase [Candidatus Micrarchaeota archaeon]|nr:dihydroorotase [Candidatus Micrarchaeota archaeon]
MELQRVPKGDAHIHLRGGKESYKATISSGMQLARMNGISFVFDMPNTNPPLTTVKAIDDRLKLAASEGCSNGYYIWAGVTADPNQIAEMVGLVEDPSYPVIGLKMYAGPSTGNLAIKGEKEQRDVHKELAKLGYTGPIAVHCEKESLFRMELWDPDRPQTWADARPETAEVESIKDQVRFILEFESDAHLHIPHVSTTQGIELRNKYSDRLSMSCGITPHHAAWSAEDMQGHSGLLKKCNPPLRKEATRRKLYNLLLDGKIDWIETDHAPHTVDEKLNPPYASGIRSLEIYAEFVYNLQRALMQRRLSQLVSAAGAVEQARLYALRRIEELTYYSIKSVFPKVKE